MIAARPDDLDNPLWTRQVGGGGGNSVLQVVPQQDNRPATIVWQTSLGTFRGEEQLTLARVLQRPPEDYRQVIVLRNLQDHSFDEIARRLDRSPGAVRMLWVRALARLKDEAEA